jgi:CxxC motif-containing protein (DUF1111 family)
VVPGRLIAALGLAAAAPFLTAASLDRALGKKLFERNWISAPSSTKSDDGLGPLYDAPSCAACHVQNPSGEVDDTSTPPGMVVRLGNAKGGPDPIYGAQLQTRGVAGQVPEANPDIRWIAKDGLRVATITPYSLGYGALAKDTKIALRRAPSIRGVGLLAQIPEEEILGHGGRAPWIMVNGKRMLGRFGWKATEPDVAAQASIAFSRDIGLSTRKDPAPWGDCSAAEKACRAGPHGAEDGEPEVSDEILSLVVKYVSALSPAPIKPNTASEKLFAAAGCSACHATLHLANGTPVPAYTDLLLHDLGPGLNDGIAEGAAAPGFWRTAPLWDVAQSLKIGGLLHDGRARNVDEAIAWHAGEAASARARYRAMSAADKAELVGFVSGL